MVMFCFLMVSLSIDNKVYLYSDNVREWLTNLRAKEKEKEESGEVVTQVLSRVVTEFKE